jgi:hypothetical protein
MTTDSAQRSDDEIIVVSGLPRSGTSLMMQMLEAGGVPILQDGRRNADASNPRGYYELEAVKASRRDVSWVADAPGHAVKVIHALLPALPQDRRYRVILMARPIAQVIRSQDRMLAASGRSAEGLSHERLREISREQLEATRRLLDTQDCFEWISIGYPELVANPEPDVRRVIEFLRLSCPESSLSSVVDRGLFRNRD